MAVERGPAADHRRLARRPVLNDPIQLIGPASLVGNSRETFHKSGTDGSNPVPSSKESATNLTGKIEPALARNRRFESVSLRHLPTQKENLAGGVAGDAPHVTAKFRAQHSA